MIGISTTTMIGLCNHCLACAIGIVATWRRRTTSSLTLSIAPMKNEGGLEVGVIVGGVIEGTISMIDLCVRPLCCVGAPGGIDADSEDVVIMTSVCQLIVNQCHFNSINFKLGRRNTF